MVWHLEGMMPGVHAGMVIHNGQPTERPVSPDMQITTQ